MPALPKLSPSSRLFTVGEIVEAIGQASNAEAVSERIKLWTRSGLLSPVDKRHKYPGTGRHRQYNQWAVIDAAVLNSMVNARVEVLARDDTRYALALAQQAYEDWKNDRAAAQRFLVLITIRGTPFAPFAGQTCYPCKGELKLEPSAESSIVVNLSQVFARVRLP